MEVLDFAKIAERLEDVCSKNLSFYFYRQLKESYPHILTLLNDKTKNFKSEKITFNQNALNMGEMETKAIDFFEQFDEDLAEKVWDILEDETTVMHVAKPSEKGGLNAVSVVEKPRSKHGNFKKPIDQYKNIYIEINLHPTNDTLGLVNVVHEFGHLMEQRVQQKIPQKTDCLMEIAPMFMERVFMQHLLQTGEIKNEEYETFLKKRNQSFVANARVLLEEDEILSNLKSPITAEQIEILQEKYKNTLRGEILNKRIEALIDKSSHVHGQHCFRYVVGEIVSMLLFDDFMKNAEITTQKFKSFCEKNAEMTEKQAFNLLLGDNYAQRMQNILKNDEKTISAN